jgi:two-component system CheB/CheR fusion protein
VVRRKILVVDDNKDAADMLNVALTMDGHDVRTVGDGLRVVAEARAFRPDIVLLDLGLPGLSGFEIAKTLKTARDTTAIVLIALTGYGQQEDRLQTRAAGFDDHLVKPVDLDSLRNAIERVAPSTT